MTPAIPDTRRASSRRGVAITISLLLHGLGLWVVQHTLSNLAVAELPQPLLVVMELAPREDVVPKPEKVVTKPVPLPPPPTSPPTARKAPVVVPALPVAVAPPPAQTAPATNPAPTTPTAPAAPTTPATPAAPSGSGVLTAASGTAAATTTSAGPANGSGSATAGTAAVVLPSSDAQYLHNPKPEYPALSRRRGESGKAIVNVLISVDGTAERAEIKVSSGFERLDQAALATVRSWRYVPGKRGGVPEAMWFSVPINFVID